MGGNDYNVVNKAQIGFTLLELLSIVAIISILTVIAIPTYFSYSTRAKAGEGMNMVAPVLTAIAEYRHTTAQWPANNAAAGISPPADYATAWISTITVTDSDPNVGNQPSVTITYNLPEVNPNNTIIFVPNEVNDIVNWECTEGSLPSWARPARCR